MSEAARISTFLADASRALAECRCEKSLLESLASVAVPALADGCAIDMMVDDGKLPSLVVARMDPAEVDQVRTLRRGTQGWTRGPAEVIRTGRSLLLSDSDPGTALIAGERGLPERLKVGLRSAIVVPLAGRGRVLGALTLVVSDRSGRRYGADDLALAEALASIAALALESVRLFESEQCARAGAERAADRTGHLQRVTAALSETLTPDQVAEVILAEGLAALGAASGIVFVPAPGGAELRILRCAGIPPEVQPRRGRERLDADAPAAQVVRTASPVFIESPEEMVARFPALETVSRQPESAAIAVLPLAVNGRVLGALGFGFSSPRSFGAEDRSFLQALARQCAQAMERGRLFVAERLARTEAVAAQHRLAFLDEASELLSSSLDRDAMLSAIARLAAPAVGDLFAILLLREEGGFSCLAAVAHPGGDDAVRRMQSAVVDPASPLGAAILAGKSLLAPKLDSAGEHELLNGSELGAVAREMGMHSGLLAPLKARGRVLGAIVAASADPIRCYGPNDLSLHEELARRIAVALDTARLLTEAKAAVCARDDFLSVASHELRTPLSALNLNVQGLLRGQRHALPIEAKLRNAERQVQRLAALIDKLLDISRITAGRLDLQLERVDLTALVADTLGRHREEMTRAAAAVSFVADGPVVGEWDRMRLEQVMTNLLSNAMKYGARGAIEVTLRSDGRWARLSVCDHGIGIAPEDQGRIFERFERAVSGRHYGGLGLGLWIVRQIVEALGGTIRVQSAPGLGSTFTVELPIGAPGSTRM